MKKILLILVVNTLASVVAHAEINHSGYCSEFERANGCSQWSGGSVMCSCPGQPAPPPPPFTGSRCGRPNPKTGDRYCCTYVNGIQEGCYQQ